MWENTRVHNKGPNLINEPRMSQDWENFINEFAFTTFEKQVIYYDRPRL